MKRLILLYAIGAVVMAAPALAQAPQGLPPGHPPVKLDKQDADTANASLDKLFDRVSPGAPIVFDDYGWLAYRKQKVAEDSWLGKRGYHILELPTGQGLLIK